jgi:hypothetical protein
MASVVIRDGQEIEWFEREKDAAAFVLHVYGLSIYDLLENKSVEIKSLDKRGPRPGDVVNVNGRDAVLGGDGLATLNARTFRDGPRVSCSGGPCVSVDAERLRFAGFRRVKVWRWADGYPGPHNDGHYYVTVPYWSPS